MKSKEKYILLNLVAITLIFISQSAFAQRTGTLQGQILDLTETGIPWAKITVGNETSTYETKPDMDGKYKLALPAGTYNLIVRSDGFLPSRKRQIKVIVDEVLEINITMHVQREYIGCFLTVDETKTDQKDQSKTDKNKSK